MPTDDFLDPAQESRRLKKAQQRAWVSGGSSGGDSGHAGAGSNSIVLPASAQATDYGAVAIAAFAEATGYAAVSIGESSQADGDYSVSLGEFANAQGTRALALGKSSGGDAFGATACGAATFAGAAQSSAFGYGAVSSFESSTAIGTGAATTAADQIMLGTASDTVVVPGTFSDPSARRLKQNIEPAPELTSVFPELFEWEYIGGDGRRRIGPMADDLVGTDAERFLVRDDDGEPAGIDKTGLHTAQIAALLARVERLEAELRERHG
jgi:hypothetical protein